MCFKDVTVEENDLFCDRVKGFTLIEVIVCLVVAAILGTMLVTFMGTGITESVKTVARVRNTYDLGKVIENMTSDYKRLMATDTTPLATFKSNVGTAGSTFNNSYGSYKVINNGYITFTCTGNNCSESSGGSSFLKVTITDPDNAQTITALFAQ